MIYIDNLLFIKQLNKNPEEYQDFSSHVIVAQRYNNDARNPKKFKSGSVISYLVCKDGTENSHTKRAYTIKEIQQNNFVIDYSYYLGQQILPVVKRLCSSFDSIDESYIAKLLNLETSSTKNQLEKLRFKQDKKHEFFKIELQKFKFCEPFIYKCPECREETIWTTPFLDDNCCILEKCSNCTSKPYLNLNYIKNVLHQKINSYIKRYYQVIYFKINF